MMMMMMMMSKRMMTTRCLVILVSWALVMVPGWCLNTDHCDGALGMQSGAIPDKHISASSYFDAAVNAVYGRAGVEAGGGAWCPRQVVQREGEEHLEVYLAHLHVVTRVEVQGRFGNGQGREYAEKYKLQYWRPGMDHWVTYTDGTGNQLLEGNSNTYLAQTTTLRPPIIAARVRFVPYSDHPRTVCMRVELYGCRYTDGLISYAMPDGDERGGDHNLRDLSYDGWRRGGWISGGLGQLNDGETGHTNFRVDALGQDRGYEWVGWRREEHNGPIEITFQFDTVRNFSAIHIYTNNFFTKDTQVFSRAVVEFSVGGQYYHAHTPVEVRPQADRIFDHARNVSIRLHANAAPAKYIRITLYFTLRWILISEVTFDSVPCRCNATVEEKPNATSTIMEGHVFESRSSVKPSDSSFPSGLLIGGLVTLGVVFGVVPVVLFLLYYRNKLTLGSEKSQSSSTSPKDRKVSMKMKDLHINLSLASVANGYSRANGKLYGHVAVDDEAGSSLYQEPYKTQMGSSQHSLSRSNEYSDTMAKNSLPHDLADSVDYAVPDMNMTPPPPFSDVYKPPPLPAPLDGAPDEMTSLHDSTIYPPVPPIATIPPPPEEQYFTASEFRQVCGIQGVTGTVVYGEAEGSDANYERPVPEMPRHRLHPLEILGDGAFGLVRLCRVEEEGTGNSRLVLMKQLHSGAKEVTKKEFHREVQTLSRIDDPSVARLVGIVTRSEPLCMLLEYMTCGDLHQFLRRHNCQDADDGYIGSERPLISYGGLIHIAVQVASGMRHLESINLVHRDLAARNCLVDRCLNVKISDIAMSRAMYARDYCRLGEENTLLPIRWMSWEAIMEGRFSSRSDVWAFGVTLWEILTLARQQPYAELSDNGVLENVAHGGGMSQLPQPSLCSREMYDLITACWRPNDRQRPPFWQVLMFLQRKHLGYTLDYP